VSRVTFNCYLSLLQAHRNDLDEAEFALGHAREIYQDGKNPRYLCFLNLAEAGVRLVGARMTEVPRVQQKLIWQAEAAITAAESKGADGSPSAVERWSDARLMLKLLRLDLQRSEEISALQRTPEG
jgi:hypothetical protein